MIFDFKCLSFELKVCKDMKNLHPFILIFLQALFLWSLFKKTVKMFSKTQFRSDVPVLGYYPALSGRYNDYTLNDYILMFLDLPFYIPPFDSVSVFSFLIIPSAAIIPVAAALTMSLESPAPSPAAKRFLMLVSICLSTFRCIA